MPGSRRTTARAAGLTRGTLAITAATALSSCVLGFDYGGYQRASGEGGSDASSGGSQSGGTGGSAGGGGAAGSGGIAGGGGGVCTPPCTAGRICTEEGCTPHWLPVSTLGAPSGRRQHSAVWTGSRMVIWGGRQGNSQLAGDGALYDPQTDTWTPLPPASAPSPREAHFGAWDGEGFLAWGGWNGGLLGDGARYDPKANTWTPLPVPGAPSPRYWVVDNASDVRPVGASGAVVWGGWADGSISVDGARFDPVAFVWKPVSTVGAPPPSYRNAPVATPTELIVWGGMQGTGGAPGGRYRPAQDVWAPIATTGAPAWRWGHVAVWTGKEMIAWGGNGGSGPLSDGGRYDPASDTWKAMSSAGQPPSDGVTNFALGGVWTGARMLVWGPEGSCLGPAHGGAYDPVTDTWAPLTEVGQPDFRCAFTTVWTGKEMIVWGGGTDSGSGQVATGGRYQP